VVAELGGQLGVLAEPGNQAARQLLADAFEQVGYQQESPSVRNSFLAGALELRSGIPAGVAPSGTGPDLIRALSTGQFLDFLGIRLDPAKAVALEFTANLITPDNGEQYVIELRNGTLTNLQGFLSDNPDLTLTIDRADLEEAMTGAAPLAQQVAQGRAPDRGRPGPADRAGGHARHFELGFEIQPGTGEAHLSGALDEFAQDPLADSAGG
jgi:linear primary-alkylsulfatase